MMELDAPLPAQIAEAFHRDGYVVLRDILSPAFVAAALARAEQNFAECRATIAAKGLHFGLHAKAGFKEIVERNPGRFEVPYRMDEPSADNPFANRAELLDNPRLIAAMDAILGDNSPAGASEAAAAAAGGGGVVDEGREAAGATAKEDGGGGGGGGSDWSGGGMKEPTGNGWRLLGRSVVMALPGAAEQQWHVDGAHVDVATHRPCHVLNVFFPLVDITEANGPTEVRPGSHYLSRDLAKMMLLAKLRKTLRAPESPLVAAGSALVFDYRTLHRGRANTTADQSRPVLVLTFAKSWFRDLYNFPKRSMMTPTTDGGTMKTNNSEEEEQPPAPPAEAPSPPSAPPAPSAASSSSELRHERMIQEGPVAREMRRRLMSGLKSEVHRLDLVNDSASHAGHAGVTASGFDVASGETHFKLTAVSDAFSGLSRVKRHQLVYGCLGDLMQTSVHALNIKAQTKAEWGASL